VHAAVRRPGQPTSEKRRGRDAQLDLMRTLLEKMRPGYMYDPLYEAYTYQHPWCCYLLDSFSIQPSPAIQWCHKSSILANSPPATQFMQGTDRLSGNFFDESMLMSHFKVSVASAFSCELKCFHHRRQVNSLEALSRCYSPHGHTFDDSFKAILQL